VPDYFLAITGIKQGGMLSPILLCLYIDGLLVALSNAGVGCFIGDYFVGALVYTDDIVLHVSQHYALYSPFVINRPMIIVSRLMPVNQNA